MGLFRDTQELPGAGHGTDGLCLPLCDPRALAWKAEAKGQPPGGRVYLPSTVSDNSGWAQAVHTTSSRDKAAAGARHGRLPANGHLLIRPQALDLSRRQPRRRPSTTDTPHYSRQAGRWLCVPPWANLRPGQTNLPTDPNSKSKAGSCTQRPRTSF